MIDQINEMVKIICIEDIRIKWFNWYGGNYEFLYVKKNDICYIRSGFSCVYDSNKRNYGIVNEEVFKSFLTLAEFREQRINSILNENGL